MRWLIGFQYEICYRQKDKISTPRNLNYENVHKVQTAQNSTPKHKTVVVRLRSTL